MARIETKAGKFEVSGYNDGYPCWITIKSGDHRDQEIGGIRHDELADLEYAISRMREKLKANERYGNEV